ncbi:MAG: CIA30 family protein [Bacteroidia bacterium]|nr:CIA30 family protein [Bacteroidia bacterium]NNF30585.1 CIA30 family protein [Flavobacteriaceae bacterium]MBT8275304.1 CIA30 family protein [Bacteroidia bacterium]NNJ81610.1 CIA30 family protein [Flavobacteriaceae bacterium]NNK53062.1 CIA30 family protein [Flavobacteriaceae bacterium]
MKALAFILVLAFTSPQGHSIDFGTDTGGNDWQVVNDDVMGGRSTSTAYLKDSGLYFSGYVSLENNGGFASVRSPYQNMDLSPYKTVTIRHRGSSRKFALSFDRHTVWYKPNYKHEFVPSEEWQETTIALKDFKESQVGRYNGETMSEDTQAKIIRMGIILYDKKAGPFTLEVDYIRFD